MRLFRLNPNPYDKYNYKNYKPEEGIYLQFIDDVPYFKTQIYGWAIRTVQSDNSSINILPIILTDSTKQELKIKLNERKFSGEEILIKYGSCHKNLNNINFIKEESSPVSKDVIVSLEVPLYAAQPYYEFEGEFAVLLGSYGNYYGKLNGNNYLEKENALCAAVIKMAEGSILKLKYTNRYNQGQIIENIVGNEFKFIAHNGYLMRFDDYEFNTNFSDFAID
ncbi:hypothetical protein [Aulosira sp. FACHB-615]|uniref:hypothetical protein n=1 Tax=Aulosira sp. FACHB-615 TaxID=2692777 RepID=UPI0016826FC8|nr:hypothetical protein [Aulosira sp. FACHB-615]MBD2490385.1 hypothetical protein [Aulosira sp. FACHB-615]